MRVAVIDQFCKDLPGFFPTGKISRVSFYQNFHIATCDFRVHFFNDSCHKVYRFNYWEIDYRLENIFKIIINDISSRSCSLSDAIGVML